MYCVYLTCHLSYRIDGVATLKRNIDVSQTAACVRIRYLEHVLLVLNLNFTVRRLIEVTLTSPLGTKSIMLRSGNTNSYSTNYVSFSTAQATSFLRLLYKIVIHTANIFYISCVQI